MAAIEYKVVCAHNVQDLIVLVSAAIEEGWEPLGGHTHASVWPAFCQSMTKKK